MQIRKDLRDISNTVEHLFELSGYFRENFLNFGRIWHAEGRAGASLDNIYKINDPELKKGVKKEKEKFIKIVEDVYKAGRGTAHTLSLALTDINSIEICPTIQEYINKIRAYQGWIDEDKKTLSSCEVIISHKKNYNVDYAAISQMIVLHRQQLKILRSFDADLRNIENSERCRIEASDLCRDWITITEAANITGNTKGHISRLAKNGKIVQNHKEGKNIRVSEISVSVYLRKQKERLELRDALDLIKDTKKQIPDKH